MPTATDEDRSLSKFETLAPDITANPVFGLAIAFMVGGLCLLLTGLVETSETVVAAGAGLSASGGILFALGAFVSQNENNRSRFYLDEARNGLNRAKRLLEDGGNDRRTWILAARTLAHTADLAKSITVHEHQIVYELDRDANRPFFHDRLLANQRGRASFFMGSDVPEEALRQAHAAQEQDPEPRMIPEAALKQVLAFARYPTSYDDPIGGRLDENEMRHIRLTFPSLYSYVRYRRVNIIIPRAWC